MSGRRGSREIIEEISLRLSSKHPTNLHNLVNKLENTPVQHVNGRKEIEARILHLVSIHRADMTEKIKSKLLRAQPSEDLLLALFPEEFATSSAGVINLSPVQGRNEVAFF
ncbi:MAG: hypothetical protein ACD_67C00200G0003 [uncultured bacterium]|nr:MAG: hypothetical protein ACD_67C00200G0003 [uncultured bacterium]